MNSRICRTGLVALLTIGACGKPVPTLTVFNAAALGPPFREALRAFAGTPPSVITAQENAPSLEVVRKVTELEVIPDVFALTIPTQAPNAELAREFVRFLLSPAGQAALYASGFSPLATPEWVGDVPPELRSATVR